MRVSEIEREAETRVSLAQRETRVLTPRYAVCVSLSERETCVQPLAKPKHEVHVLLLERKTRIQLLVRPKREVRFSLPEHETRV